MKGALSVCMGLSGSAGRGFPCAVAPRTPRMLSAGPAIALLLTAGLFFSTPLAARMSSETVNFAPGFVSDPDASYRVADMDGDGKADIVRINCDKGYVAIGFSLGAGRNLKPSTTSGWVPDQAFHPYDVRNGVCSPGEEIEIADLDGNGAGDLLIYSFDPMGPPEPGAEGGKLDGRLAVVDKVEGASNPNANTNAFWYEHPTGGVNYAWTHVFQGAPDWVYTHKGFSARFPLIPRLPGQAGKRSKVIRHGDVSCDDKPDLVRFDLTSGEVWVHTDQSSGTEPGCAFTGKAAPNAPAKCDFHSAGRRWLSDFARDDDEPHLGHLFPLAGGGTVAGILNFNRHDNRVYSTFSTCGYFEPMGQGFMASNPRPVFGHTRDPKMDHDGGRFIGEATHLFLADMNRDGFDDIVSFDQDSQGRRSMWVALNDGSGRFGTWTAKPYVPILWMSEPPNQDPKDTRPRHFGLGDVDGDHYIDYVMFPDTSTQPRARVRFQIVNYLGIFESSSLRDLTMHKDVPSSYKDQFLSTQYFPKLTHYYSAGYGRYHGDGVKAVVDPFVSFDNERLGWTRNPYGDKPGAAFYLYDFIGGVGQCPGGSSGVPQRWEDRHGLSDVEQDAMFTCALSDHYWLRPKQFTDVAKLEQTKHGIFHHNFQAMIATTREEGDCDGWPELWWYVGRMFRTGGKGHYEGREAFALFMHSIRHCTEQTETDARIMAHEYGHALNLQHDDAYNFRPAKVKLPELEWWFKRNNGGRNSTIMRTKSYDQNRYCFWFGPPAALHLAGQKPDPVSGKRVCEDADARVHGTWYTGHANGPTRWSEYVCKYPLSPGQSCKPGDKLWLRLQRHREQWQAFWK